MPIRESALSDTLSSPMGQMRPSQSAIASIPLPIAARVASTRSSVLITGETGSGKGYLARWMHDHSDRADGPFLPVNCAAVPEGIIDSHLFGHARGSFSDAHHDHTGLVRSAHGGTLFLDEVNELPLKVQVRLLRLLEEREVQPVGTCRPLSVNVRVIAAAGCDIERLQMQLRADLFYRLNVIHLGIRPLRERVSDIAEFADGFNREFAERVGRAPLTFSPGAEREIRNNAWPGNVRQLRTVIERLHVLCPHTRIDGRDLREYGQLEPAEEPVPRRSLRRGVSRLQEARLEAVRQTLDVCGGNITRAASALGVHRSTIHRWLASERLSA